jgi:hypothetical protein
MPDLRRYVPVLATAMVISGCFDQPFVPGDESNDRVEITNDELELEQRVQLLDDEIDIDPASPSAAFVAIRSADATNIDAPARMGPGIGSITLTLKAEAVPPIVSGQSVQATSVSASAGNRAIVSYNMVGATALGAIDLFQVLGNGNPVLRSSASVLDADINAISFDDTYAYAAMASSDPARTFPAVVERFLISGNKFTLDGLVQAQLGSFAATSTASTGSVVYATSGSTGSAYALNPTDMTVLGEFPLDDARWVTVDAANRRVVVAQGTPGRLSVFTEGSFPGGSMDLLDTFPFPGADVSESKSTVEVHGGKAFVAAGPEGVQVVCLDNGQIVGNVPRPDPGSLGLDPSVVVTNAVTVQDDLMFISNGEAGVYAAVGAESFETSACDAPQMITVLGQLQFANLQSANHVVYTGGQLYVAAGLGGVKIVSVQVRR